MAGFIPRKYRSGPRQEIVLGNLGVEQQQTNPRLIIDRISTSVHCRWVICIFQNLFGRSNSPKSLDPPTQHFVLTWQFPRLGISHYRLVPFIFFIQVNDGFLFLHHKSALSYLDDQLEYSI